MGEEKREQRIEQPAGASGSATDPALRRELEGMRSVRDALGRIRRRAAEAGGGVPVLAAYVAGDGVRVLFPEPLTREGELLEQRATSPGSDVRAALSEDRSVDVALEGAGAGRRRWRTLPIAAADVRAALLIPTGTAVDAEEDIRHAVAGHGGVLDLIHEAERLRERNRGMEQEMAALRRELDERIRLAAEELEERNRRLEWQSRELERVSRLKSEFLASTSHELRTPINAILGYTSLLREEIYGDLTDKQKSGLDKISVASRHLLDLINDILDLSKIEAGKMLVHLEEVPVRQLASELAQAVEPLAREKGLRLSVEADRNLPVLFSDPTKIKQILLNLLSNAIKFTADGEVRLTAERAGEDRIRIAVSDTGIGIREEHQEMVFSDFRQLDQSPTRKHGGTGLGLTITRQLVTLLNGEISVSSTYGEGSTFTVELPVRVEPEPTAERVRRVQFDRKETFDAGATPDLGSFERPELKSVGGDLERLGSAAAVSLLGLGLAYLLFRKTDERRRFTFGFVWFFIGLAYTSAAACKLVGTGFDWSSGHHLWLWIHERGTDVLAGEGSFDLNVFQELLLQNWWMATAVLTFGWITEACGWMLWWRPLRPYITTALIGLHLGIGASMNLWFAQFMYELILIGYPWPLVIDKVWAWAEDRWMRGTGVWT